MLTAGAKRAGLYIPPAWTNVLVDPEPDAKIVATGFDVAGRKQYLYSTAWMAQAKSDKFERVRQLLSEGPDILSQIEGDINLDDQGDAPLVALLTFLTGVRPGSTADTLAKVQAYGATTLRLKHVQPAARGVRLRFTGKKGVRQNVLVTEPWLVHVLLERKQAGQPNDTLFRCSASKLNAYIATLGSGSFTAKDFRTHRGTKLALELLGKRVRLPRAESKRKKLVNAALDKVARQLGNTRTVVRNSYVDPSVVESILNKTACGRATKN